MSAASPADGVLPVDKPSGPTSHDVVVAARRALGTRRVGHTGTLDPFASGLLLLCVGQATRLAEYLTALPKRYVGVVELGVSTDTDDREGRIIATSDAWRALTREAVAEAFAEQVGARLQVPPAYSAKKIAGERAHRRVRRGEVVEPAPVPVEIYRLDVLEYRPPEVEIEVECSSGTYVRAIARDVGRRLGCGAHLEALRRTAIGPHRVERAVPLDALTDPEAVGRAWLPPLEALAHMPKVQTSPGDAQRLARGLAVDAAPDASLEGPVAVAAEGELVAIAEAGGGRLQPRKVFLRVA